MTARWGLRGRRLWLSLGLSLGLAGLAAVLGPGFWPQDYTTGMIRSPQISLPRGAITAPVVLISDEGGWGAGEQAEARHLARRGMAVIGLDLPQFLRDLAGHSGACAYALSDIEALSRRLQQDNPGEYRLPVIAGRGAGGAMALALAAQTPASTVAATLAVDPSPGIALQAPLCTQAPRVDRGGLAIYGLDPAGPNNPISVVFTPQAPEAGRAHVADLLAVSGGLALRDSPGPGAQALRAGLDGLLATARQAEGPLDLPITALPAKPSRDTMAVIYSGDGGWRDLDQQIGKYLQAAGVPVVGVDALRYFWNARSPEATAADLARILAQYRAQWGVKNILLIGYSFGADILPATVNLLPAEDRAALAQVTLLALSHQRRYEIQMSGWLGLGGAGDGDPVEDLAQIPPALVQCIYGTKDPEDACQSQQGQGYELIGIAGGHHFDGDYRALTARILAGLDRRLAAMPGRGQGAQAAPDGGHDAAPLGAPTLGDLGQTARDPAL